MSKGLTQTSASLWDDPGCREGDSQYGADGQPDWRRGEEAEQRVSPDILRQL